MQLACEWGSRCPDCGSTGKVVDHREAELVCTGCGLVLEDRLIVDAPERRAFAEDGKEDPSRVGYSTTWSSHLTLGIDTSTAYGKQLAKVHAQINNHDDAGKKRVPRGVTAVMREFHDAVSHMGIAEHVRHLAEEMFAEFILACPMVANNRKTAFAACVYYASNNTERKRSMEEIAAAFEIGKSYGRICNKVHETLRSRKEWSSMFLDRKISGADIVGRMVYCQPTISNDKVPLVIRACDTILGQLAAKDMFRGKNPHGVNIAVIVHACKTLEVDAGPEEIMLGCKNAGFPVCRNQFAETTRELAAFLAEDEENKENRENMDKGKGQNQSKREDNNDFTFPVLKKKCLSPNKVFMGSMSASSSR